MLVSLPQEQQTPVRPQAVTYWAILLGGAIYKMLNTSMAPFDVSAFQFIILDMCFREEANTVSSIARILPFDPSAVSRQVEKLRSRGLMESTRLETDRRVVRLSLTEKGVKLTTQLINAAIETDKEVTQHLNTNDKDTLRKLIRKLAIRMEERRDSTG